MKKIFVLLVVCLSNLLLYSQTYWNPISSTTSGSMVLIGKIQVNGIDQTSEQLELGVFCGNECRGACIAHLFTYVQPNYYMVDPMVYGEAGNMFTFKLYDHSLGQELNLTSPEAIAFDENGIGNPFSPYILNFTGSVTESYTITTTANPVNGGTVSGGGTYQSGEVCTVTATPANGYSFVSWKEGNQVVSTNASYSFTVTGNRTLVATFSQQTYTISVSASPSSGGTATVSGNGQFNYGQTCTVTATPSNGYSFVSWKVDNQVVSTNASYTFTVTGNRTLVATFSQQSYTISVSANPSSGSTATVSGNGQFTYGQSCTVTATPANGYSFVSWKEGNQVVSTNASYSFTVTGNRTLVATFNQQSYTISVSASPSSGGTATVSGNGQFTYGQSCTVTATPANGYSFVSWKEGGQVVSTNPSYSFTVTGNRTLVATFSQQSYTISASASPSSGGTATVSGNGHFTYGQSCTVTATPANGYTFINWTENGQVVSGAGASYTFNVTGNRNLVANFSQQSYTISVSANPSSGGTVSGGGQFTYGQSCTVTATPANGYSFVSWKEGSQVVSTNPSFSFTVTGNRTLVATFSQQSYTISVSANPSSGGTVSGSGQFTYGQSCTVTATPANGYSFVSWKEGNQVVSTNASYNFTVTGNRTLVATFSQQSYTISVSASPSSGGTATVSGNGQFTYGQSCTVTATPANGYSFVNWKEGSQVVSTNSSYTFTVTGNRTLVAYFQTQSQGPTGAINSLFSVSSSQQVCFSQGNLQYKASTNTWQFAANQYDYIGNNNGNISETYNGWIDLFGWGTSGYNHGAVCYQPWSTSTTFSDYYAYGSPIFSLFDETGQADWGYNAISNGGGQTNQWRTLTTQEWQYVFNTRTTTSGILYAKAKVNNVNGVILLPDDWSSSTYSLSNTNQSGADYTSNTISSTQWNTLQDAGAVFLPAAGSREGTSVNDIGSYGYYWSASSLYNINNYAYFVFFSSIGLGTGDISDRFYGNSVRLVCPAQNNSFTINTIANPSEGGTVSGGGQYTYGQTCTVTATPASGYTFVNWEESIQIGEGTSTTGYFPFYTYYNYSIAENLFLASELQEAGFTTTPMSSLSWFATNDPGYPVKGVKIWMANVSDTELTTTSHTIDGMTLVCDYPENFMIPQGWYEFVFNTGNNFAWDGHSNLLIFVQRNQGEWHSAIQWQAHNAGFIAQSYRYQDSGAYDVMVPNTMNTTSMRPDIIFKVVLTNASFSFTVTGNRTLVANFATSSNVPTGAINGLFSVSDSQQVYFSQGNLQYIGSATTPYWKFADNQWDVLGTTSGQNSTNQNVDRDLFGWGTSGYNHGAVCYQPWSTSTIYSDYYAYGSSSYNLYDQNGKADWGYNAISNGGGQTNQWRTLTHEEWVFVFYTRTTSSGIRFALANVNGVNGMILLPDDWNSSTYSFNSPNVAGGYYYDVDVISGSQWNILENSGAVFLPTAGFRDGNSVNNVGSRGYYWSASYSNTYNVWSVFDHAPNSISYPDYRYFGLSVRLVRMSTNNTLTINATANPAEGGLVSGGGSYDEGATCTLTATANPGFVFVNWTENDVVVSTTPTYSFTVTASRSLVANYLGNTHIVTAVNNPADGGTMNGLIPLPIIDSVDFETGNLANYGFDNSVSDYPWVMWNDNVHLGNHCMASGNCGIHNSESFIEMTVDFVTDGFVEFYSKVSSQYNDKGRFFVDGTKVLEESGTNSTWKKRFFEVSAGSHTFRWCYYKDNTTSSGEDRYYVDDIKFGLCNYAQDQTCTLTAMDNEGYSFVNWTENGEVVSNDPVYSFTVTRNRSLMANYRYSNFDVPYGTLAGSFSVSASEQVLFSQGNLEYIGSASIPYWKFTEHQWDYLEADIQTGNSSEANRDRFGWGTSGYDHGAVCYQPWSNSAYYGDYYAYGQFYYDLSDETGKADWGYNPILNGGNTEHLWRTLKLTEWVYLFLRRTTSSGIRYAKANVNNVNGVILLPDDWNASYYPLNSTNQGSANYSSNTISSSQWGVLEQHGAVFLPACDSGSTGRYWSSTYENANDARCVEFSNGSLYSNEETTRPSRLSVRLVRPVQGISFTINVTANPEEWGHVNVSGGNPYDYNTLVHVNAVAEEGYQFDHWVINDTIVEYANPYIFNITHDMNLVAHFAVAQYDITLSANPAEGGAVTGAGTYTHGDIATLIATANEGYEFLEWQSNGDTFATDDTLVFPVTESLNLVALFESQSVEQTIELENGWKWISSYVAYDENSLSNLENAISASEVIAATIKSQTKYRTYEDGNWYGTMSEMENENMYMVQLDQSLTVTLSGPVVNPEDYPITLNKGWNWINFLSPTTMSLENALVNLDINVDDVIKGQNGFSTYSGIAWVGSLKNLVPGKGYMYQNMGDESLTLVYPTAAKGSVEEEPIELHWKSDPYRFAHNLNMMVSVENLTLDEGSHEIGAFVNGECRGSALIQEVEGQTLAFLTVSGEAGDLVSFKVYDVNANEELIGVEEKIVFANDALYGNLRQPYMLHLNAHGTNKLNSQVSVFPNPTNDQLNIQGHDIKQVTIFNTLGQKVLEREAQSNAVSISMKSLPKGVYLLQVMTEDGLDTRKVVKE